MLGTFRLVRSELGFNFTIFLSSLLLLFVRNGSDVGRRIPAEIGWAAAVTVVSYFILDAMKYLDSFRPRPSRADLLTLYSTLLLPFALLKVIYFSFTGHTIISYREIIVGALFVAFAGWCFRYVSGLAFERSGQKRTVWLLLNGAETVGIRAALESEGLAPYYSLSGNADDADLVITSRTGSGHFGNSPDLLLAYLNGVPVRDVRVVMAEIRGREDLEALDLWFFLLTATPLNRTFRLFVKLKSVLEPLLAAIILIVFLPVATLVALGVRLSSPGPVLFRQRRLGYKGREFELVKFRTMVADAEKGGPAWAGQQASKVTRFGNFLRRSHLDEIPQLWNVIRGEMSFVGPRPERPEYYAILSQDIPLFWVRTLVRPGVTGWAQVTGGYASSVDESREKLEYDLYYMRRMSLVLDLKILFKTLLMFLAARDENAL